MKEGKKEKKQEIKSEEDIVERGVLGTKKKSRKKQKETRE